MGGCVLTFWSCLSGTRRSVGYEAPRYLCSRKPFKSVQDFCWDCRSAAFTTEKAICLALHVHLLFLTSEILQMASYEHIFLAFFHVHVMLIVCHCLWSVPLQGSWWSRMRSDCSPIWGGLNWPSLGRLGYGAIGMKWWINPEDTARQLGNLQAAHRQQEAGGRSAQWNTETQLWESDVQCWHLHVHNLEIWFDYGVQNKSWLIYLYIYIQCTDAL